jgi:hypothetical protein
MCRMVYFTSNYTLVRADDRKLEHQLRRTSHRDPARYPKEENSIDAEVS